MNTDKQQLILERRALVADLRSCGSDRLTRATIEAQIKMIDGQLASAQPKKRIPPPPCAHCFQPMRASQVVSHGDAWVHADCREAMRMEAASARARAMFGIELEDL